MPLAETGCDSYVSIYPEFKKFIRTLTIDEIVDEMLSLLPNNQWNDCHLVITGGEPLLGWQRVYPDILEHPKMVNLHNITFETNGTQPLTEDFKEYLRTWHQYQRPHRKNGEITFSVSPKLSCSGESRENAIKPDVVWDLQNYGYTYLKFVVATEQDVEEALDVTEIYRKNKFHGPVYLMPVGGVDSVYQLNKTQVANMALKHGLRFSDRLHVALWGNSWAT